MSRSQDNEQLHLTQPKLHCCLRFQRAETLHGVALHNKTQMEALTRQTFLKQLDTVNYPHSPPAAEDTPMHRGYFMNQVVDRL